MVRTCRKLPKEWEKYDTIGEVIENTRIVTFKTPLRDELHSRIDKSLKFTTMNLFRKLAENGYSLGLVINVNNTDRYYDRAEIEGMMIQYKEIFCPGRGFLLRTDLVKQFCKTIDEFMSVNQENDLLIGVHCTNGVNRSGYLICRYLIERLNWSSHQALDAFERARGYPIERGSFVQALHKADREHRIKIQQNINTEIGEDDVDEGRSEKKKRRKKKREESDDMAGLDPALTAQMMQQFFQMEQQFKEAAESAISGPSYSSSPFLPSEGLTPSQSFSTPPQVAVSNINGKNYAKQSLSQLTNESYSQSQATGSTPGDVGEEEDEESNADRIIDFDSMGKVDVKETSASEQRRLRRKRLDKQFQVMKRGRFWEINELRKNTGY